MHLLPDKSLRYGKLYKNLQYSKFSTDDSTAMTTSYVHLHCNQRNSIEFILNSTDFHRPFSNSIQE